MHQDSLFDTIIVGGGPGGLVAAEYLGRFLRNVLVIDSGQSRAAWIPKSHNYPGFPNGISGKDLLESLRAQVRNLGIEIMKDEVMIVGKGADGVFDVRTPSRSFRAHTVIVASGMIDEQPNIPGIETLVYNTVVRFCPVCDGFEAMGKRVGIVGPCSRIYKKARFLRTYTSHIVLFPLDEGDCDEEERERLHSLGISIPDKAVESLIIHDDGVTGMWDDGTESDVDILYPAMGAKMRTGYLSGLNVAVNESGCILTDTHQQTNVEGLYAIGDVTVDLAQISVALGQAAIAATAIHNHLPLACRDEKDFQQAAKDFSATPVKEVSAF